MVGIIWFVQIVHYPLFASVGGNSFVAYEVSHTRLTTPVVEPLLLIEGITAVLLFWYRPGGVSLFPVWLGLGLLLVIWFSTVFLQIPLHNLLSAGFEPAVHRALVISNWLRTGAWSARALLVLWMAARIMP
jgi:hypothetical protein